MDAPRLIADPARRVSSPESDPQLFNAFEEISQTGVATPGPPSPLVAALAQAILDGQAKRTGLWSRTDGMVGPMGEDDRSSRAVADGDRATRQDQAALTVVPRWARQTRSA